jgi:RNA polymerase-interacting CarD/CdnL/TRCF family regulator
MAKAPTETVIGDGSFHIGDRVVYPKQGIYRIVGVEVKEVGGYKMEFVTLTREARADAARQEDQAKVLVPSSKVMSVGLRKVANVELIDDMFDYLTSPSDDPQLDWKVRHRENDDKMSGGGLFGTAEVLKGLHALTRVRPLPQKERELYDNARHLLVNEIAAACDVPLHVAENNLDYALFPPPGMKRKGRELKLAVVPATAPLKPMRDDDDLGFDDELDEEAAAGPGAKGQEGEGDEAEVAEAAPAKPAKAKLRAVPEPDEDGDEDGGDAPEGDEVPGPSPKAKAEKPAPKPAKAAPKAEKPASKVEKPAAKAEKAPAKAAAKEEKKPPAKPVAKAAPKAEKKPAAKPAPKAKAAAKPAAHAAAHTTKGKK